MAVRVGRATIDGLMTSSRNPKQVLIAGAGVAGLEAALALQALTEDEVSVELVAPEAEFTYRPLAVTEPFRVGEVKRFPLRRLAEAAGARLRAGSVAAVDSERKVVTLENGQELTYDILLLALGARPREAVTGALTFRGPQDGPALSALLDKTTAGEIHRIAFAVPTGAGWPLPLYELAVLTAEYATAHGTRGVETFFVTPEDHPLGLFGPTASEAVSELLASREIQVKTSVTPIHFEAGELSIVAEQPIAVDAVVALPQLEGPRLPGVPMTSTGSSLPTSTAGCSASPMSTPPATSPSSRSSREGSRRSRRTPPRRRSQPTPAPT